MKKLSKLSIFDECMNPELSENEMRETVGDMEEPMIVSLIVWHTSQKNWVEIILALVIL